MTLPRTNTTQRLDSGVAPVNLTAIANNANDSIKVEEQEVRVTYPAAANDFRITTAVVPAGSKWHAGAHWHEGYDEIMKVVKGRAKVRLGNEYRIVTPEDGEVVIPKFVVHDVMRADFDSEVGEGDEGELWLEERSDPVDGSKELLFRNIFSIMEDKTLYGWKFPLQLLLTMAYSDGYLVIIPGPARWYVTHALWACVKFVALAAGLKPFYAEYTPARLQAVAEKLQDAEKKKLA
ncbi:hypothetical protein K504DRAFT_458449 [Pleomassaria siparia CBS 279.74]|uniref:Cupin 2 conserved barrel domain-containing protein n=1 Tax=Pleomassaria siparia CBS 279.74 TaxID=1314801 RepID=A0A6G1K3G2_9PLEO|nr:hypothetical protein K504DRAFT_458449 [Pleomassaria siparia CBS 279.74]